MRHVKNSFPPSLRAPQLIVLVVVRLNENCRSNCLNISGNKLNWPLQKPNLDYGPRRNATPILMNLKVRFWSLFKATNYMYARETFQLLWLFLDIVALSSIKLIALCSKQALHLRHWNSHQFQMPKLRFHNTCVVCSFYIFMLPFQYIFLWKRPFKKCSKKKILFFFKTVVHNSCSSNSATHKNMGDSNIEK